MPMEHDGPWIVTDPFDDQLGRRTMPTTDEMDQELLTAVYQRAMDDVRDRSEPNPIAAGPFGGTPGYTASVGLYLQMRQVMKGGALYGAATAAPMEVHVHTQPASFAEPKPDETDDADYVMSPFHGGPVLRENAAAAWERWAWKNRFYLDSILPNGFLETLRQRWERGPETAEE